MFFRFSVYASSKSHTSRENHFPRQVLSDLFPLFQNNSKEKVHIQSITRVWHLPSHWHRFRHKWPGLSKSRIVPISYSVIPDRGRRQAFWACCCRTFYGIIKTFLSLSRNSFFFLLERSYWNWKIPSRIYPATRNLFFRWGNDGERMWWPHQNWKRKTIKWMVLLIFLFSKSRWVGRVAWRVQQCNVCYKFN